MFFLCLPFLLGAQIPSGYYNGTEGLSGYTLKSKLKDIISNKAISWNYGDLPGFYTITDVDRYYENDGSLLDIYSEIPDGPDAYEYDFTQMIGSASAEGQGWNREHMMPQSTFYSNYPMYSDLFFVVPTDARINQLRSNYPYGKAGSTIYYTFTNGSKQASNGTPGATYTGRIYEPIDEFKGDVARTLLYFAVRYEGKLGTFKYDTSTDPTKDTNPLNGTEEKAYDDWFIQMLINWSNQDPVSQKEIDRNNYVYTIQNNRNPFIDHPEWINLIWNQTQSITTPDAPTNLQITKNSAYFVSLKWNASNDLGVIGYEVYQNGNVVAKTNSTSITIDKLSPSSGYNFSVKAYSNAYLRSPDSNIVNATTLANDIYAKDLMITKFICGSTNNRALEVINLTGHEVNLQGYRVSIQQKSGSNYFFASPLELDGKVASGEKFVIINARASLSCFDTMDGKFISASPALSFFGTNYVELNYMNSTVDAVGTKNTDNTNSNKTLYRLATVSQPTVNFDPSEWQTYGNNYCTGLGSPLAVQEVPAQNIFSIYPNPASDSLFLQGKDKVNSVEIYDMTGKKILSQSKIFENKIDIRSLSKGMYLLKVNNQTLKFIKN